MAKKTLEQEMDQFEQDTDAQAAGSPLMKAISQLTNVVQKAMAGGGPGRVVHRDEAPNSHDDSENSEDEEVDDAEPVQEEDDHIKASQKRARGGDDKMPAVKVPAQKSMMAEPQGKRPVYQTDDDEDEDADEREPAEQEEPADDEQEEQQQPARRQAPRQMAPKGQPMRRSMETLTEESITKALAEDPNADEYFEAIEASAPLEALDRAVRKGLAVLSQQISDVSERMTVFEQAQEAVLKSQAFMIEHYQAPAVEVEAPYSKPMAGSTLNMKGQVPDNLRLTSKTGEAVVTKSQKVTKKAGIAKQDLKDVVMHLVSERVMKSSRIAELDYVTDASAQDWINGLREEERAAVVESLSKLSA